VPPTGWRTTASPATLVTDLRSLARLSSAQSRSINFRVDLRVDIQALGWMSGRRYRPLHDDIASTAIFYLDRPSARPPLPDADDLEVGAEAMEPPS